MKSTCFLIIFELALVFAKPSKNVRVINSENEIVDENSDWWKSAVFYQIYPRSFKDSDNDGSGDIQGIIQKLDHIKDLGVSGIWLSPVYKSPQVDNGYDISDYRDIDPLFGTLDDLKQLIQEAHKLDIKVILDYVPNHTSDKHEWFQRSLKRDPYYDDFYIWENGTIVDGVRQPPNNWICSFKGSAWEWNEQRQQFYFHQFSTAQPDLNYRNPNVVNEMKDVLRYWLEFGCDGFRMDAVPTLFEDKELRDEPPSGRPGYGPDDPEYLSHIYTTDQNETIDMIYQFREVIDEFNHQNQSYDRIMMTEVYSDVNHTMLYYGTPDGSRLGAHFTFNFLTFILNLGKGFSAEDINNSVSLWLQSIPQQYTSNWVLGNHDNPRVSTRLGTENIDGLNMLVAILPGIQITYNGEEIGMENGEVKCDEGYDPQAIKNCTTFAETSRDFERTPFHWDNSTNAGFDEGAKPWLPVSKKYVETNLDRQKNYAGYSHYSIYKQLVELRKEFKRNSTDRVEWGLLSENIFGVITTSDKIRYSLFFNVGDVEEKVTSDYCDRCLTVALASTNSDYKINDTFSFDNPLKPKESLILKWVIEN